MKLKKLLILSSILLFVIAILFIFINKNSNNIINNQKAVIKSFYSSYSSKNIALHNSSVVEDLKIKKSEETKLIESLYDDILQFNLIDIKEVPVTSPSFNGKVFDKSNIAKFEIFYEVDFDKNISSSEEGKVSTIKILTRENKDSPWLIAGQEGHGL